MNNESVLEWLNNAVPTPPHDLTGTPCFASVLASDGLRYSFSRWILKLADRPVTSEEFAHQIKEVSKHAIDTLTKIGVFPVQIRHYLKTGSDQYREVCPFSDQFGETVEEGGKSKTFNCYV